MALVAEAQAVATPVLGPRVPNWMEMFPEPAFSMSLGMVKAEILEGALFTEPLMLGLEFKDSADTGADDDADAVRILGGEVDVTVLDGLNGGGDGKLGEAIHSLGGPSALDPTVDVEVAAFAGDPRGVLGGVKEGEGSDPGTPGDEGVPELRNRVPHRGDDSHAGDHNATFIHADNLDKRNLTKSPGLDEPTEHSVPGCAELPRCRRIEGRETPLGALGAGNIAAPPRSH